MVTQVVEIAKDGYHLSKYRGFLTLKREGKEVGRVPLDDITILILSAHQITLSKALLVELAERKTPVMTCGKNYHPLAFSLPYDCHFDQVGIMWTQIDCSQPFAKRLWQSVVREKEYWLSGYNILWMLVMFDLPVVEKSDRKEATRFRNFLLDQGFAMAQFSVYYRMISGKDSGRTMEKKIRNNLPEYGSVQILSITDKQYENISVFKGKQRKDHEKRQQLLLF